MGICCWRWRYCAHNLFAIKQCEYWKEPNKDQKKPATNIVMMMMMKMAKERKVGACSRQERIPLTMKKMNWTQTLVRIFLPWHFSSATCHTTNTQLKWWIQNVKLKSLTNYYRSNVRSTRKHTPFETHTHTHKAQSTNTNIMHSLLLEWHFISFFTAIIYITRYYDENDKWKLHKIIVIIALTHKKNNTENEQRHELLRCLK